MRTLLILLFTFSLLQSFSQSDTVYCQVFGNSSDAGEWNSTNWSINGEIQDYSGCGSPSVYPSIHVAVIDKFTCESWGTYNCEQGSGICGNCVMLNADHQFGNENNDCGICRTRVEKYFIFRQNDASSMAYLDTMLTNPILNGHYLLMYSFNSTDFDFINSNYPNTVQICQNLGFVNIVTTDSIRPFIYFAEVGNASSAIEVYGSTLPGSFISLSAPFTACATNETDENSIDFTIYPTILRNGEFINVSLDEIEIYNLNGNLVQQSNSSSEKYHISNLAPGIYILKIRKGNNLINQKIAVLE